jgi:hypothetical protein
MYIKFNFLNINMEKTKPILKSTTKSTLNSKNNIKKDLKSRKREDITLDFKKIEKVSLTIYSFFTIFILIGLIHFLYISLGFIGFEFYYFYILLGFIFFYLTGKKAISFAFHLGSN